MVGGEPVIVEVDENLSVSQLQSIMLCEKAGCGVDEGGDVGGIAQGERDAVLRNTALAQEANKEEFNLERKYAVTGIDFPVSVLESGQESIPYNGKKVTKSKLNEVTNNGLSLAGDIKDSDELGAQIFHVGSTDYIYVASAKGEQLKVCELSGVQDKEIIIKVCDNELPKFEGVTVRVSNGETCKNAWKGRPEVHYYEVGDNKGLPAIIPFGYPGKSLDGGWYVWVSNSAGTWADDMVQGYKASGDVRNFYVCNIGENGRMESRGGDDMCQNFDVNSEVKQFAPCAKIAPSKIRARAMEAIKQASRQSGENSINIFGQSIKKGNPAALTGGAECQDFMSPGDCKFMFNVCDPVICPPSRCDFGGAFPVSDVIQTGIIGSLLLCLPNAKEGIFMPICLSGVHAGLDNYVSILKSERDCLEHSVETGEMIGICDEITSIYKCEFFWRQMSPLMDQVIPGIISYAINGNKVRGGGEYMLVQDSWNVMKKNIAYFKDYYAQNAFKAFNIRSTQEVGSAFCKSFVGTSVPGSANFIENLIAPESPSQFYAHFSEAAFTEATVPATGHYNVYFHIYAGNDQGVQYKVYLRDPPASSYYSNSPEISVASGYIAAGESADESKDFTAPTGYKELCVVINAQEECGFKQVGTSFALDYVSDKYVEEQATQTNIMTEKECISGQASALSLVSPNLQAGAEEIVNPEISMRGIVRVCATQNPEAGVISGNWIKCSKENEAKVCNVKGGFECEDEYCESRSEEGVMQTGGSSWEDVGHCGDVNLRCWLDTDSVKDALERIEALEGGSVEVLDKQRGLIDSGVLDLEGVRAVLSKARGDIGDLTVLTDDELEKEGKEIIVHLRLKSVVDNGKYRECLVEKIGVGKKITVMVGGEPVIVEVDENLSVSQLQSIMLCEKAGCGVDEGGDVGGIAQGERDAVLRNTALAQEANKEEFNLERKYAVTGIDFPVSVLESGQESIPYNGKKVTKSKLNEVTNNGLSLAGDIKDSDELGAQIFHVGSTDYIYVASAKGEQLKVCELSGVQDKEIIIKVCDNELPKFEGVTVRVSNGETCKNAWKGRPEVHYYEVGDNKGLPAIIPFGYPGKSLDGGWYVWVSNSAGTWADDMVQGYKASGDVRNFYVCNIGENGRMESRGGDDMCQNFDVNSEVKQFAPCAKIAPSKIRARAMEAIKQASRQSGENSINIFGQSIKKGNPAALTGGAECQDFMSPGDCKFMFNVCDPVICPPSRCDFGGAFPVSDVIQTGIIGSLLLCLPNAKEGIFMPICLSGVHAGLDNYVSILKSERDCLEHSVETGEMIGICDEITSIYKCEFFWRQMSPLMDQVIPGIISYAINGNKVRGGGEYMLVQDSWNVMKKNIAYFKDYYAQNAFKAFNIRSTQEVGSAFCKSFVGTSVPGSANFIENLIAPESPSQFYAHFSEAAFTEATVPATGHYNVYFHIYAGNDQGVQYKVYLRDPPASSYYSNSPEISVASGYIAAGESADESKDFTAPTGYKELCVVINAQEECGFKQVGTSFALDYVSDKYVEEQATQTNIMTEKECISGQASALSLVSPNLQAGAEEIVNPEISMRGIVRVCATQNPEAGVISGNWIKCSKENEAKVCNVKGGFECEDEYCESRSEEGVMQTGGSSWEDVGHCGDVNLRCWLDTDSVKDALERIEALEGGSVEVLDKQRGLIDSGVLDLEGVRAVLSKARGDIGDLTVLTDDELEKEGKEIIVQLERVIGNNTDSGAGTNGDRAEALALKASVLRLMSLLKVEKGEKRDSDEDSWNDAEGGEGETEDIDCERYCEERGYAEPYDLEYEECMDGVPEAFYGSGCCCSGKIEDDEEEDGDDDESQNRESVDCRAEIKARIVEIAGQVERYGFDESVESEGVAGCFEELALMIAAKESNFKHCKDESRGCLECGGSGYDNVYIGKDEKSSGVMQVNKDVHSGNFEKFETNVKYALERVLVPGYLRYRDNGREYLCHPDNNEGGIVEYKGWRAGLRGYNGWNTNCAVGDLDYVERVLDKKGEFEDVCNDEYLDAQEE